MDDALLVIVEMHEWLWDRFTRDLEHVSPDEVDWRPTPDANTINLIVRHLRIDTPWHVASIEADTPQSPVSAPLDFEVNVRELGGAWARFIEGLRRTPSAVLRQQTALAYRDARSRGAPVPEHFLAFHLALHVARHWGQIRAIRNSYSRMRGEPARFVPENPTFPRA